MTTTISRENLNAFVTAFCARFAERASGESPDAHRITQRRPSDFVLTGFLTTRQDSTDAIEDAAIEDLPRDRPYEQTSIGIEWLTSTGADAIDVIDVAVSFAVFVRRYPTYDELKGRLVWRRSHDAAAVKLADIPAVWTREQFAEINFSVPFQALLQEKRRRFSLGDSVAAWWAENVDPSDLFLSKATLTVSESDVETSESYDGWRRMHEKRSVPPADWLPEVSFRVVPTGSPDSARISVRLANRSEPASKRSVDFVDPNLYSVKLAVTIPANLHRGGTFRELRNSFRYDRSLTAVGLNCGVATSQAGDRLTLSTVSMPTKRTYRLEPREISEARPTFAALASDPMPVLNAILADMVRFDAHDWERKLAALSGAERAEADAARKQFKIEIEAFHRGIALLGDSRYENVARAFRLMNMVMSRAAAKYEAWRLFQIVFIISRIPTLAGREYSELRADNDDDVSVLWFAAGGGKTEAFFGLLVFEAFFDRLRGKLLGTTAFLRFPLRLLTFQQMQRLSRVLGVAEAVRIEHLLGGEKFSVGYFVGRGVTPNRIDNELHAQFARDGVPTRFQRLFECPFCRGGVVLRYEPKARLIQHCCDTASCSYRGPLPLYIVDDDIYRYLPTVVVSTVDKFALFGQNRRFANLFGRISGYCSIHGADFFGTNKGVCPSAANTKGEPTPCEALFSYGPFRDLGPSLLVQDELHLVSEELGTFDAHYETAIIEMSRSLGQKPWNVIAATATIEAVDNHVWSLYLRRTQQFPGAGPDAFESFYYTENKSRIGRLFLGLVGIGRKHTPAVARALSLIYQELHHAATLAESEPGEANARYGTVGLSRDDFQTLLRLYELPLTYVLTRKGSDQVSEAIESRVKGELREFDPAAANLRIETFNGGVDVSEMIRILEEIRAPQSGSELPRVRGIVTTNIIGHGVDVDEFNIMVFAGFTRHVAEYIQASGRVGRTWPGISIFVATPQSERDRSVLTRFDKFHEYLDRLVDPSAINRWPAPAVARTARGILAGYLMSVASAEARIPISDVATVKRLSHSLKALQQNEIVAWMQRAYGSESGSPRYREQIATTVLNLYRSIITAPTSAGNPIQLNRHLDAMMSLRDVDDAAFIIIPFERDAQVVRKASHA